MQINRERFFAGYAAAFGALKQAQVDALNALLANLEGDQRLRDVRQQAYALATARHETNATFAPVREAYWLSEEWRRVNS